MLRKQGPPVRVVLTRVVLPAGLVLGLTAAAMAYYNYQVTGRPLTMPYHVHEATYGSVPLFLWQPLPTPPHYNHPVLEENHLGWALQEYLQQRSPSGFLRFAAARCGKLLGFYLGLTLLLPLVALRPALRNPWNRFALLTCLVELAASGLATFGLPHYVAPITGLIFLLVVQGLRQVRLGRWHGLPVGRAYVRALPLAYLVLVVLSLFVEQRAGPEARHRQRAAILARLDRESGRHLVLVRYRPKPLGMDHEEWVYNGADIDAAKVVWAREMGPAEDRALLEYFGDRHVWRVDADATSPCLEPYPGLPAVISSPPPTPQTSGCRSDTSASPCNRSATTPPRTP
jgi:hypothetical protein